MKTIELEEFYRDSRLIQPSIIPERIEFQNGRWYKYNDEYKKSVTTMTSVIPKNIGFEIALGNAVSYKIIKKEWNELAEQGSHIHTLIAHLILQNEIPIIDEPESVIKRLYEFVQFWNYYSTKEHPILPLTIECRSFHPEVPFAGTLDFVGKIWSKKNNCYKTVLIDWKTGKEWETYKYQLPCYKLLFEKLFNLKIDFMWNVYLGEYKGNNIPSIDDKAKYKIKKIEDISIETIMLINDFYELTHQGKVPVEKSEYPATIKLKEGE